MKLKTIAAAALALGAVGVGATINPGTALAHNATVACLTRGTIVQSNDFRTAVTITYTTSDGTLVATSTVAAAPSSTPVTNTLAYPSLPSGALATRWSAVWPDGFRQPSSGTNAIPGTCTPAVVPTTTTTAQAPATTQATNAPTTTQATTAPTTTATTAPTTTAAPTTVATTVVTTAPTTTATTAPTTTTSTTTPICTVPGHPEQPPIKCPGGTSTTLADTTSTSVADTPTDESTTSVATEVGDATDTDTTASTQAPADSSVGGSAADDQPVVTALARTGADGNGSVLLGAGLLTLVGIGLVLTVRLLPRARLD